MSRCFFYLFYVCHVMGDVMTMFTPRTTPCPSNSKLSITSVKYDYFWCHGQKKCLKQQNYSEQNSCFHWIVGLYGQCALSGSRSVVCVLCSMAATARSWARWMRQIGIWMRAERCTRTEWMPMRMAKQTIDKQFDAYLIRLECLGRHKSRHGQQNGAELQIQWTHKYDNLVW